MRRKEISFKGQTIYAGIDVHKTTWVVTVMTEVGNYEKKFSIPASPQKFFETLKKNYPDARYEAVYEAGFTGFSTYYHLKELGINCSIVNAADVPTTDEERRNKTDAVDSAKLARCLKNGELHPIYVLPKESLDARGVVRVRKTFLKQLNGYKVRIKHLLYNNGVEYPERFAKSSTHWSRAFTRWLCEEVSLLSEDRVALNLLLEQVEYLRLSVLKATRKLRELSQMPFYKKNFDHLFTIPGIGVITAMTILTEIVDPTRFTNERAYTKYVGFIPDCHDSGDHKSKGEMTGRGNNRLRMAYIEAAWIAIRKDTALCSAYLRYCQKMEKNEAIVRIARSLAHISLALVKNDKDYVPA